MKHKVLIFSFLKERDKSSKLNFHIEDRIELSDEDIEQIALDKWMNDHELKIQDDRSYEAELVETIH